MQPCIMLPPRPDARWTLAQQMGLETAVVRFWGMDEWWTYETLQETAATFEAHGFSLDVIEDRPPMEHTVLGLPGRDAEIEAVIELIQNMGRLGIDCYCWVWTELPLGVLRTSRSVPSRGGSMVSAFDHAWFADAPPHPAADITEDELWDNLAYFLDAIVPVAEEAGVRLALHPDDPPLSPIRGVPRIVTSIDAYERILSLSDSPNHGVTFCQGNVAAMGADIQAAIRRLGDRIHFVHFRDVAGDATKFHETWHDDGPTDMRAAIDTYREVGFDGPIRPDHVPRLVDEPDREDAMAGYTSLGRLYAVGYLKGLLA